MEWLAVLAGGPSLPEYCSPTNDFLLRFSSTFHTCVPTPLAFTSVLLGALSIVAWLCAQLPQIYKNWSISSTSGLSIFFLAEWCLGDLGNLLGAIFTHQASWQVAIGAYYVFVDLCLVLQWLWYEKLQHGSIIRQIKPKEGGHETGGDMQGVVIEGVPVSDTDGSTDQGAVDAGKLSQGSRPRIIFHTPTFDQSRTDDDDDEKPSPGLSTTPGGTSIRRAGRSSPIPSPSPRTMLLLACVVALTHASPITHTPTPMPFAVLPAPTRLEVAGTILSWGSTVLYLGSRVPQLLKNYRRKSTAGLSPHLFVAAFCGNFFYSAALLTNPNAWHDAPTHGSHGWAGPAGNDRAAWSTAALPFFLGAAGVLFLDASVGAQFVVYGEREDKFVEFERDGGPRWHWRRVSGWMRGWVPSISEPERETLLERSGGEEEVQSEGRDEYGTLS